MREWLPVIAPSVILKGGTCRKTLVLSVNMCFQTGLWSMAGVGLGVDGGCHRGDRKEEPLGKEMIGIFKGLSEQWLW